MNRYTLLEIEGGEEKQIQAESDAAAMLAAVEWVKNDDYDFDTTELVTVWVCRDRDCEILVGKVTVEVAGRAAGANEN